MSPHHRTLAVSHRGLTVLSTDERPYKCAKCGKSFRESGALTRHLKSLTPCTEKIRFSISKDTAVGKEEVPAGQLGGEFLGLGFPKLTARLKD